jgi:hypothetical protein
VLRDSQRNEWIKNGTVSFIDTGTAVFAVTACHVIDACIADAETPDFVQCMIGGPLNTLYFKLKDRLIDRNQAMDLATLKVSECEIVNLGCSVFRGLQIGWPPPPTERDYGVIFCGYPGKSRSLLSPRDIMFGRAGAATTVSSAREAKISLLIEREKMVQRLGDGELTDDYDFGGISGGPLVVAAQKAGKLGWMAAGIITSGPNPGSDPSQDSISGLDLFQATPIQFVKENGYLDTERWHNANP